MSNKFKDVNIKNRIYYFFNDMINIENFDPNNIKIEEKSLKNIEIPLIDFQGGSLGLCLAEKTIKFAIC